MAKNSHQIKITHFDPFHPNRDIKQTESGLDSVERHSESEIRRVERGVHPADAKLAVEQIEQELRAMEHTIQEMFQDCHVLREGRYPQAADLHRRLVAFGSFL